MKCDEMTIVPNTIGFNKEMFHLGFGFGFDCRSGILTLEKKKSWGKGQQRTRLAAYNM